MIVNNNVPNPIWNKAIGSDRFPPYSWSGGGGGLGRFGSFSSFGNVPAIMSDVLDALDRTVSDLLAQSYARFDVPENVRVSSLEIIRDVQLELDMLKRAQSAVNSGSESFSSWLSKAENVSLTLGQVSVGIGHDLTGWLSSIISGAEAGNVPAAPGMSNKVLVGVGALIAAGIGYKLLFK